MKQPADKFTSDMFSVRRGRPRKAAAKSGAQRQREFRERRKLKDLISVTRNEKCDA